MVECVCIAQSTIDAMIEYFPRQHADTSESISLNNPVISDPNTHTTQAPTIHGTHFTAEIAEILLDPNRNCRKYRKHILLVRHSHVNVAKHAKLEDRSIIGTGTELSI